MCLILQRKNDKEKQSYLKMSEDIFDRLTEIWDDICADTGVEITGENGPVHDWRWVNWRWRQDQRIELVPLNQNEEEVGAIPMEGHMTIHRGARVVVVKRWRDENIYDFFLFHPDSEFH